MRVQSLLCRLGLVVASVTALAGVPSGAAAQTSTGSVRGYVKDSSGAPIAGAQVVATNVQTSAQRVSTTQSTGFYSIVGLAPAEYEVTARQIGMAPQKTRVRVLIAEVFPLDFKLGATAVQLEAVTVAAAAGVETRTSEVATSVTPQQMRQLPSASHNFLDLAALAPGVTVSPDFTNLGSSNAGVQDKSFSYGAQGPGQVNVFIDGASLKNDLTGGESGIHGGTFGQDASRGNPFPRDAVQEYRVIAQNFKAEYQQSSGAIIVATTKSGGNVWTGDASFGYQNKDLVAQDSITRAQKFTKPDYTRYLAGASVSGPLVKDKLFFFGSYEGNYQNRDATVNLTPTILPPAGAFPALDSVNLAKYGGNFSSPFRETLVFGKLNYNLGTHSTAELSFNDRHETDVRDFGGFGAFDGAINHTVDATTTILKHNYFSGPWLNEVNFTYEHFTQEPTPDTPGIPQRWFFIQTTSTCCVTIGSNLSTQAFTQKRAAVRDDITYSGFHGGGDHVMKAGVSAAFLTYDIDKANNITPQFFFSQNPSQFDAGCAPTCTGSEAYNYRVPFQVVWAYGNPNLTKNNNQIGAYIQDDWSPTPRLTINLGIRWDFESNMFNYDYVTPADVRDTIRRYDNAPTTPAESLVAKLDTTNYFTNGTQRKKFYGAFQPRVGFSYALDAESKTTIYGGWGLYYDRMYFDVVVDEILKLTRPTYTVHFADPDSTPTAGQTAWQNSYMTTDTTVLKSLIAGSTAGREVWLISNDVKPPKSSQFNLGIRHLFGDVAVSATYVGVRSWDGFVFNWGNFSLNPDGTCCKGGGYGHGFSNIIFSTTSAKTWYDALQVEVERPYKRTGNWNWGGGISYTSGSRSLEGSNAVGDVFSTFPRSSAYPKHPANDEKSRLVAHWIMDVPYAAGFQFGGLITLGTGPRYNVGGIFPLTSYTPGGFTPPQHPFIFPGAWAYREVDFRLRKDFPNISGTTLGVTVDVFNVFNWNNFSYPDNNNGNPAPNGLLSDPRKTQIGVEYHF